MHDGVAYGFRSLGTVGVADVEIWGNEHQAGDLKEYLRGEGEEGTGKRGNRIAELWAYVSRLLREVSEWGGWSVPWGRCVRAMLASSRGSSDFCGKAIV